MGAPGGITADQYRVKYVDALIRSVKTTAKRQKAIKNGRKSQAYEGTKSIVCPPCKQPYEASKFSGVTDCPQGVLASLENH